jgi:hypothetical protein
VASEVFQAGDLVGSRRFKAEILRIGLKAPLAVSPARLKIDAVALYEVRRGNVCG